MNNPSFNPTDPNRNTLNSYWFQSICLPLILLPYPVCIHLVTYSKSKYTGGFRAWPLKPDHWDYIQTPLFIFQLCDLGHVLCFCFLIGKQEIIGLSTSYSIVVRIQYINNIKCLVQCSTNV